MDKTRMRLSFFNEQSGLETKWQITMETTNGVRSLVDAIRHPWEDEFGVELDIGMVPFSDSDSETEDQYHQCRLSCFAGNFQILASPNTNQHVIVKTHFENRVIANPLLKPWHSTHGGPRYPSRLENRATASDTLAEATRCSTRAVCESIWS